MNKVILTGNLVRDVELRSTQNGKNVVSNCIAVSRDYKDADGNYGTDFINFVAWTNQADYLNKYARKGDKMEIVGRWQTRQFEDGKGNKQTANEVVIENVKVFPAKKDEVKEDDGFTDTPEQELEPIDDLPF